MHTPHEVENHKLVISSIKKTIESESESFKHQATTVTTDKSSVTARGKLPNNTPSTDETSRNFLMTTSSQAHAGNLSFIRQRRQSPISCRQNRDNPTMAQSWKERHPRCAFFSKPKAVCDGSPWYWSPEQLTNASQAKGAQKGCIQMPTPIRRHIQILPCKDA